MTVVYGGVSGSAARKALKLRVQAESPFSQDITTYSEVYLITMENIQLREKESPEDAFHFFLLDVQKKVKERGAAFISEMAASMWEHMAPEERCVYKEKPRNKEHNLSHV